MLWRKLKHRRTNEYIHRTLWYISKSANFWHLYVCVYVNSPRYRSYINFQFDPRHGCLIFWWLVVLLEIISILPWPKHQCTRCAQCLKGLLFVQGSNRSLRYVSYRRYILSRWSLRYDIALLTFPDIYDLVYRRNASPFLPIALLFYWCRKHIGYRGNGTTVLIAYERMIK